MATRTVTLRQVHDMRFDALSGSGHAGSLDGTSATAMSPTEAVLMALGACGAMDVASILRKMRHEPESHEVIVSGEQRPDHPRKFTSITVTHRVAGDVPEANLRRAVFLSSTRYCPVHAMLAPTVDITDRYEIWSNGRLVAEGTIDPAAE